MGAGDQEFDHDAAERVLRRAIHLSERDDADLHSGLSERALIEAAEELGIDSSIVRTAVAEERGGALVGQGGRMDRLVGPAVVSATRVLDLPSDRAMDAVDRWLRRVGSLRRQRRADAGDTATGDGGSVAVYTRRSDAAAGVQRTLRSVTGHEQLGRVGQLRVSTFPVDDARSLVVLAADLGTERTATLAGGASVTAAGSTVSIAGMLLGTGWTWIGVPVSAALGVGVLRTRAHGLPSVELSLDGVLDRIAAGDQPGGVLDDVRSRLRDMGRAPGMGRRRSV